MRVSVSVRVSVRLSVGARVSVNPSVISVWVGVRMCRCVRVRVCSSRCICEKIAAARFGGVHVQLCALGCARARVK